MPKLPQRQTLVEQLVVLLRQEIARGAWRDWLPSERTLSTTLQVSRNTLRTALKQLRREGVIHPMHGSGNRISVTSVTANLDDPPRDIAILSPDPIERLRPNVALFIERLRRLCGAAGYQLHLVPGRQYFRSNPGPPLQKLLRQRPQACWVLTLSSEPTQRWFADSGVPCVVAGSVFDGVALPYCSQDHRAACAHAAQLLLDLGHRKVAILLRNSRLAADLESNEGFNSGISQSGVRGAQAIICHHEDSVLGITQQLRQVMRQSSPPTAILVTNAHYYLTVIGCLQQMGRQVPRDISLLSRNDDPFLSYITPTPARYVFDPQTMANGVLHLVKTWLETGKPPAQSVRLMPRFIHGESLRGPMAIHPG